MSLSEILKKETFTPEDIAFLQKVDVVELRLLAQKQEWKSLFLEVIDRIPDDDVCRKIFISLF